MKPIEELTRTEGYWLTTIQSDLYAKVEQFRQARGWTRSRLAEHLGVSKGYVSQIFTGDFDHKLSSLIRLALAVDKVPNLKLQDPAEYAENFVSGYDFCLNEKNIQVIITVPTAKATEQTRVADDLFDDDDNDQGLSLHLLDREPTILYRPRPAAATVARTPIYG